MKLRLFLFFLLFASLFTFNTHASQNEDINFKNIVGNWSLSYENGYGYNFKFNKNYKAEIVLYLNSDSITFKGIYNIEHKGIIKIDIIEMKRDEKINGRITKGSFKKAKSSYFMFHAKIFSDNDKKFMELIPVKIIIDGNDSQGFFEPLIKLQRAGNK